MINYSIQRDKRYSTYAIILIGFFLLYYLLDILFIKNIEVSNQGVNTVIYFVKIILQLSPFLFTYLFIKYCKGISYKMAGISDISGEYDVKFKTSYDDMTSEREAKIIIKQTFYKIKVIFKTEQSTSVARSVFINFDEDGIYLTYTYFNDSNNKVETMHKHDGACNLIIKNNKVTGNYFNHPERGNCGDIF